MQVGVGVICVLPKYIEKVNSTASTVWNILGRSRDSDRPLMVNWPSRQIAGQMITDQSHPRIASVEADRRRASPAEKLLRVTDCVEIDDN